MSTRRVGIRYVLDRQIETPMRPRSPTQLHVLHGLAAEGEVRMIRIDAGVEHGDRRAGAFHRQRVMDIVTAGDLTGRVVRVLKPRIEVDALDGSPLPHRLDLRAREQRPAIGSCRSGMTLTPSAVSAAASLDFLNVTMTSCGPLRAAMRCASTGSRKAAAEAANERREANEQARRRNSDRSMMRAREVSRTLNRRPWQRVPSTRCGGKNRLQVRHVCPMSRAYSLPCESIHVNHGIADTATQTIVY